MYSSDGVTKKKGGGKEFGGLVISTSEFVFPSADINLVGRLHETGDVEPKA